MLYFSALFKCAKFIVGMIIGKICKQNLVTFDAFEHACINAVERSTPVLQVQALDRIPDYDKMYEGFNDGNIRGTFDLHLLRIEGLRNKDGESSIQVLISSL